MLSFEFAGKNSYLDFDIYVEKRPTIPSPKRRVSYLTVPGRNGSLKYDENAFEDISIAVECGIAGNVYGRIDEIKAWLLGSGENHLSFSFQNDKCYLAQVVNSIDFEVSLRRIGKFIIVFNCRPFKYATNNSPITITSSGTNLINTGTLMSEPIIEVFGSGDITLQVNEQVVTLIGVSGKIILNSVLQDAYDDMLQNQNSKKKGDFIELQVGNNQISWIGNVTKLAITPNWRWL